MIKKPNYILLILVWIATLLVGQYSHAQEYVIKNIGIPFMTGFGPGDYSFGSQNFDVLVGDDQKIYFANTEGILVYDGYNWITLVLPSKPHVYSLTKSKDGRIYVGAVNEIGYLDSSPNGELEYISLNEKLGDEVKESFTSWNNFTIGDKIIFSNTHKLFIYDHLTREMDIVKCPDAKWSMRVSRDIVYSHRGDSLYRLNGLEWEFIRISKLYQGEQGRKVLLVDIDDSKTLAITENGFFDFGTERRLSIDKKVEDFLSTSTPYSVNLLHGRYIAICTLKGLLITDLAGNPVQLLDKKKGLTSDLILHTALDNSEVLWVSTYNGIDRVEVFSPFTIVDGRMGVEGTINHIEKYKGDIYLASPSGIYKQNWESLQRPMETVTFEKMRPETSWAMIQAENELFGLTQSNTLVLNNDSFVPIPGTSDGIFWSGFKYTDTDDVLLGSSMGDLMHLSKENGKWNVKKKMPTIFLEARYMAKGDGDDIWVSNRNHGIYKLSYDKGKAEIIKEKRYGIAEGLPSDVENYIFSISKQPYFPTSKGIYRYDAENDKFVRDERFTDSVGEDPVYELCEDKEGTLYYYSKGLYKLNKIEDGFEKIKVTNNKLIKYDPIQIAALDSKNVLIGTYNAFLHIDPTLSQIDKSYDVKFSKVTSLNNPDSAFFGGFGNLLGPLNFSYNDNAIRINYSAAYYQNNDQTLYKWRMIGPNNKKEWSTWTTEYKKDFTNLVHGNYAFEVMARNIIGTESSIATIQFEIATPWYHTSWAYIFYAFLVYLFILTIVKFYTKRLKDDKLKLEGIVKERTLEISQQKEKVERDALTITEQNNKLMQMDDLKNRFFLNISHELRTPLTLTMGTVDQAIKGKYGVLNKVLQANLMVSLSNSKKLLKMVNNILDISKLEGGKMKIEPTRVKPSEILSKVLDFFTSKFVQKDIILKSELIDVELYVDKDKFETIFINLFANAYKFTGQHGIITVAMQEDESSVHFTVNDNGIGIPKDDLPFVFDRFYQSSLTKNGEGTGLGLALSKELVALHKGEITVSSDDFSGTTFTVAFLKGKDHFSSSIISDNMNDEVSTFEEKIPLHEVVALDENNPVILRENNSNAEKPHLLLVEDNPEMSGFIRSLLSDDYSISWVQNGVKGLDFLKEQKPDLIITDYLMPEMDGFEMATEIKKSEELAFIPIIFLTARAQEQDKVNVLNLGVDDYLYKPFNAEELQVRIKNLLNTKKQRAAFLLEKNEEPLEIEWKEFSSKLKVDIDAYIKEHIAEEIRGEELAASTGLSERSLYRKIKANTGLSLMQYIKEYRLRTARTMLEGKMMHTVADVSYAVGFNYQSHFTKSYKERFGKNPSEYLD